LVFKVTQKLHTENQLTQVVDFINYFSWVTIEWEEKHRKESNLENE